MVKWTFFMYVKTSRLSSRGSEVTFTLIHIGSSIGGVKPLSLTYIAKDQSLGFLSFYNGSFTERTWKQG